MTPEEKLAGEAVKYSMPAIEDYMATRCLLLSGLFVGLTLAHEATEKIMKSLLIIEKTAFPQSCHDLTTLAVYLFSPVVKEYTNWPYLRLTDNRAIKNRKEWERRFLEWFTPKK